MTQRKHTFCRICEPACPLIAEFDEGGQLAALRPDREHPSGSIACHKGVSFLEVVHNDPDRVNWPQKRLNPKSEPRGVFAEIGWDAAMAEIGGRIRSLRDTYGPNAIGVYHGNPFSMNSAALLLANEFQDRLETSMRFSALTQDTSNKFTVLGAVYGSNEAIVIPDLKHTDYLLCLGANPRVSRWTMLSTTHDWDIIRDIPRRGGKVRFVNPRKTESSTDDTGPTIFIKPGTDVYLLAAVLNEIERKTGFASPIVAKYGKNIDRLKDFVRRHPAARAEKVTGIPAATIEEIAADILAAKSAVVYMATGVNQSRQGTLSYLLVHMLNFVTGNLGRKGGTYRPAGLFDPFQPVQGAQKVETSIGAFYLPNPIGFFALPGAMMTDLIESGDMRALIVLGGNPVLAMGGGARARAAYAKLDLAVSLDIYRSAWGEICDFVLPSADWLERPDINLLGTGQQPVPYVQYTDAMVAPAHGRRNDWWTLARLLQAVGLPSPLDGDPDMKPEDAIAGVLALRGLTIHQMRGMAHQSAVLEQASYDSLFERCVKHADGKIDCFPESFVDAGLIDRCEAIYSELMADDGRLKIVGLRTHFMHNSWFGNAANFRTGRHAENALHMAESDAKAHGLSAGDPVKVWSDYGEIYTRVYIDDGMSPGTVAMTHGFGYENSFGLRFSNQNPGADYNTLMPVGAGTYEPLSYMSWLTGVPVQVARAGIPQSN
jgi:anaerobic selenocysteine-containing dehydrogenase